jgi:hypothetical protein
MKKTTQLIILVAALVVIMACGKPSVENETNKYNHNQKNLKELAAKYPAFHPFLAIISKDSFKRVTESRKIEDKVKKAEKIAEANQVFSDSKLYLQLNSYDGRIESIIKKKAKLGSVRSNKHRTTISNAISKANQAMVDASAVMKNAKPADMEAAVAEVKKANGILIGAEHKLNSAQRLTKKKTTSPFKKKKKK